ncbi:unnamed protein product [Cuscuta epithymum]|uniref:Uncharacterized protein n=1 Tax=Cuscuta epithymum TaxID=186058 RepID=A0AAV0F1I5_9ASTE|nr:unnamed protein product [Cuscuta epithymum]CAH9129371.1 unnamed protein product [Cuscuta epithymum]
MNIKPPLTIDLVTKLYSQEKAKGGSSITSSDQIKKSVRFDEGCNQVILFSPTEDATRHTKPPMQKKKKAGGCACGTPTHSSSLKCRLHRNRWASAPLKITSRRPGSVDDSQISQFTRFGRAILKSFQF